MGHESRRIRDGKKSPGANQNFTQLKLKRTRKIGGITVQQKQKYQKKWFKKYTNL